MKRITVNALIACSAVLLTLMALEAVVRLGGETDADGQFTFMGYVLEPYALPVGRQRRALERYLENRDRSSRFIYDEMLGWTYRPNDTRQSGTFTTNSAGLRSQREYSQRPLPDTVRIALFGDSFTAGDEVSDDETWGHQLEMKLNQAGIRVEALNFGVTAYGMDQAFLRWQKTGRDYAPDIVIFGFQSENLNRNVNIFSILYFRWNAFSKPRFVLTAGGGIELLNSPTIPPEQIIDALESFGSHPLAKHEHHYQSYDVVSRWLSFSRLASYLYEALKQPEDDEDGQNDFWTFSDGPDGERGALGKAIVDAFANDVKEHAAAFFVLYLPNRSDLRRTHDGEPQGHQLLLDYFDDAYHYITFEDQLDRSHLDHGWGQHHYLPAITSIAAQTVADEIQNCIESGACELPRFEDRNVIFTSAP